MIENLQNLAIDSLVPHQGAMCLLHRVVDAGDDWLIAEAHIHSDNLYMLPEGVPSWLGIEYMAQTISALAGLRELKTQGEVKLGFLLGTRKYTVNQAFFPVGSVLRIKVEEVVLGENGLGAFDCEIESEGLVAKANLNVFQPSNPEEFLSRG
ncbi:hypothetical protein TDB9533_04224 [Thalassocella blandensis]|nr:hypothetical protein TDB9533_04224 [Thalassocella blandensis]